MAPSNKQQPTTRSVLKSTFGSLRHRPTSTVPTGTVASRVSYLQSLASSASRHTPSSLKASTSIRSKRPPPKQEFEADDDRGGYGRRTSATFGYPAHRNDEPHEDPPEEKGHTIMGWQIKRAKNDDDNKSLSSTTSKRGFRAKVKDAFTHGDRHDQSSPEIVVVNTKAVPVSVRRRPNEYNEQAQIVKPAYPPSSTAVPTSRRVTVVAVGQAQPPQLAKVASRDFAEEASVSGHKVHNWLAGAGSGSEDSVGQSVATTSTGRVRSVQQMYSSYGIPEPTELFSPALPSSRLTGGPARRCHVCKWVNVGVERCSCCGHRLCADCALETNPVSRSSHAVEETATLLLDEDDIEFEDDIIFPTYSISEVTRKTSIEFRMENWNKSKPTDRKRSSRHSPMTVVKKPTPKVGVFEERFDLPQRDPSIAFPHQHISGDGPSPPNVIKRATPLVAESLSAQFQPLREQRESLNRTPPIPPEVLIAYAETLTPPPAAVQEVPQEKKKSMVKDSPFLKADKNPVKRRSPKQKKLTHAVEKPAQPVSSAPKTQKPAHEAESRVVHGSRTQGKVETIVKDDEGSSMKCDSPGCRATHAGHRPYRHSISCSRKNGTAETVANTPTSPKDFSKVKAASPSSALVPKPLSPVKRKTDEMKALDTVIGHPVVTAVLGDKLELENASQKMSRFPAVEPESRRAQPSPYSQAVVSVLTPKTDLVSPLGSDGNEDEGSVVTDKPHKRAPSASNSDRKKHHWENSASGSDYATITSTGQITTIYETSIIEHPPNIKRKKRPHQRSAHRQSQHKPFSFSSDTPRPSRSSAERSHEELVKQKHQALCHHPALYASDPHSAATFGFCPSTPHTHRIHHSTEYIDCEGQPSEVSHDYALRSSIILNNTNGQEHYSRSSTATDNHTNKKQSKKHRRQHHGTRTSGRPYSREQRSTRANHKMETYTLRDPHRDFTTHVVDHDTFTTTHRSNGNHPQTNTANISSSCLPGEAETRRMDTESKNAMNKRNSLTAGFDDDGNISGNGGPKRLKQLGNSVVNRGNSVMQKGRDVHKQIVKPRVRLEDRKRRAKYGDMDVSLADQRHGGDERAPRQDRHSYPESEQHEVDNGRFSSFDTSDYTEEAEPSTRVSYLQRRQARPDRQSRGGDAHYRQDREMHSRAMEQDNRYGKDTDSFEHLSNQPSFGIEYRHQSHPAQGRRRNSPVPNRAQRNGQSIAGHELPSHRDTGQEYTDSSEDSSYYERNHSTISGLSREIVFESAHGQGAMVLPVAIEDETKHISGSDIEREQSRKVNRAGLRMSKSVRHIVGATGPVVPVVKPILMEDNMLSGDEEVESEDELAHDHKVNRAGLRMSNSVRHVVGADGSTSFSHSVPQIASGSSRYGNRSSNGYLGSHIDRSEAPSFGDPAPLNTGTSYTSSSKKSDAPTLSLASHQRASVYRISTGQLSSQDTHTDHDEPVPSIEQPYYYASAPGILTADEEAIRAQSFSASKMSLFEKQVTASPQLDLVRVQERERSASASGSSDGEFYVRRTHGVDDDATPKPVPRPRETGFSEEVISSGKRRMVQSPRTDASKKRKVSENKDDEEVAAAAANMVASFFQDARARAVQSLVPGIGGNRTNAPSVQSLREKFSQTTVEKGNPAAGSNPFRQHMGYAESLLRQSKLTTQGSKTTEAPNTVHGGAAQPIQPSQATAFSSDGGRSRVHTISAKESPRLMVMEEAGGDESLGEDEIAALPSGKAKPAFDVTPKPSKLATSKKILDLLSSFLESSTFTVPADSASPRDFTYSHHQVTAVHPSTPSPAMSTPPLTQPPSSGTKDGVISRQTARCALCENIVFKGSLEAHVERCSLERVQEMIRKEKEAKELAARERGTSPTGSGSSKEDAISIADDDDETVVEAVKMVAGKLPRDGHADSEKFSGAGKVVDAANGTALAGHGDSSLMPPITTDRVRRGTVSSLAAKFQQTPPAQAVPSFARHQALHKATAPTFSSPKIGESARVDMGTDGASRGTPLPVPLPASAPNTVLVLTLPPAAKRKERGEEKEGGKMPKEFVEWLAGRIGIGAEEIRSVEVEVEIKDGKGKRLIVFGA